MMSQSKQHVNFFTVDVQIGTVKNSLAFHPVHLFLGDCSLNETFAEASAVYSSSLLGYN